MDITWPYRCRPVRGISVRAYPRLTLRLRCNVSHWKRVARMFPWSGSCRPNDTCVSCSVVMASVCLVSYQLVQPFRVLSDSSILIGGSVKIWDRGVSSILLLSVVKCQLHIANHETMLTEFCWLENHVVVSSQFDLCQHPRLEHDSPRKSLSGLCNKY